MDMYMKLQIYVTDKSFKNCLSAIIKIVLKRNVCKSFFVDNIVSTLFIVSEKSRYTFRMTF